ncbi:hypothetical protein ACTWKC_22115 [Bacillus sp. 4A_MP3]
MFRQKKGISPTALLIGSSLLIAALSPEIRRKITGMVSGRMQHKDDAHSMQPAEMIKQAFGGESGGQQHTDKARHSQGGSMQPAEMIKQAFGGESGGQRHTDKARHSPSGSMQPAEMIKQAFGGESGGQRHEQTSGQHSGSSSSSHEHSRSHTDGQADRRKRLRQSLTIRSRFTLKKAR